MNKARLDQLGTLTTPIVIELGYSARLLEFAREFTSENKIHQVQLENKNFVLTSKDFGIQLYEIENQRFNVYLDGTLWGHVTF